jgi:hypothetical protein
MPNSHYDSKVKLVLGKTHTDFSNDSDKSEGESSSNLMKSVRQVFQKPDISRIQLLSWMRDLKKSRSKDTHQSGREWTRFMAGYVRSNANGNDVI